MLIVLAVVLVVVLPYCMAALLLLRLMLVSSGGKGLLVLQPSRSRRLGHLVVQLPRQGSWKRLVVEVVLLQNGRN